MQRMKYILIPAVCLVLGVLAIILNGGARATEPTTSARSSRVEGLIEVKVRGTQVDITPDYVNLIVDNPKLERRAAIDAGASPCGPREFDTGVSFRRVIYGFSAPDSWKNLRGFQLKAGDVIYTFNVESAEERASLLKRAKLTKKAGVLQYNDGSASQVMFTSKGYYVIVMAPAPAVYECSMHPEISQAKPGQCSKCHMVLIETWHYR